VNERHGCSFWLDNFAAGIIAHLNQRDVTLVAASRAPAPASSPTRSA
jgi:predicted dithiol-disulfide oxidoreductase (DUF899 family)